ncbi:MAG: glyoxalase [Actinomycetia bacterium]|nr:glyoxalase [Actinomycetes bacterium]MCP4959331.1 glyoxalase [Actinomycetes bacterium]
MSLGSTTLVFDDPEGPPAITAWSLTDVSGGDQPIDGLPLVDAIGSAERGSHPNGAISFDHVVVRTPDVIRTQEVFARRGFDLRRERTAGTETHPILQSFYRLGEVVLEVVGPAIGPETEPRNETEPSSFWGLVANVEDIEVAMKATKGLVKHPRPAVQPGRRIATMHAELGLGVPFAFMDDRAQPEVL